MALPLSFPRGTAHIPWPALIFMATVVPSAYPHPMSPPPIHPPHRMIHLDENTHSVNGSPQPSRSRLKPLVKQECLQDQSLPTIPRSAQICTLTSLWLPHRSLLFLISMPFSSLPPFTTSCTSVHSGSPTTPMSALSHHSQLMHPSPPTVQTAFSLHCQPLAWHTVGAQQIPLNPLGEQLHRERVYLNC